MVEHDITRFAATWASSSTTLVAMWSEMGGQERYDRRKEWFHQNRQHFLDALS